MKNIFLLLILGIPFVSNGQALSQAFLNAVKSFESDPQLKHALFSLEVVESGSGKVVYSRNSEIGMAPASTQKLFTSIAALDLLGPDFRFETKFGYQGEIKDGTLEGDIVIDGSGDPTLGSDRYISSGRMALSGELSKAFNTIGAHRLSGGLLGVIGEFESVKIPGGWIWEDIANYYGAGTGALNWNENQYDIIFSPGKLVGEDVKIIKTVPNIPYEFQNELKTGAKGSGDQVIIYLVPGKDLNLLIGTVPCCVDSFVVSGSIAPDEVYFLSQVERTLTNAGLQISENPSKTILRKPGFIYKPIFSHYSPTLDSINYWFLKKSINLYGEALVKKIAAQNHLAPGTEKGIDAIIDYWKQNGIESDELHIVDGSGLSPQNRVTAHALVTALQTARSRPWFNLFMKALPVQNGIRMKSGTINRVKCYAGYLDGRSGKDYSFAFMVNNYNGSSSALVQKMWKILDLLK